jgi:hypothetical protein
VCVCVCVCVYMCWVDGNRMIWVAGLMEEATIRLSETMEMCLPHTVITMTTTKTQKTTICNDTSKHVSVDILLKAPQNKNV